MAYDTAFISLMCAFMKLEKEIIDGTLQVKDYQQLGMIRWKHI